MSDQISEVASFKSTAGELSKETMSGIMESPPQFIYCSAESAMEKDFLDQLKNNDSLIYVSVVEVALLTGLFSSGRERTGKFPLSCELSVGSKCSAEVARVRS